jgi:dolichol-phosphate mannosyltransferase
VENEAAAPETSRSVLVVIPTYNEADNIASIIARTFAVTPDAHVLVVDDGSPDGTGRLVDDLAVEDERVHAIHRAEKSGLGAAYLAGFTWAFERNYSTIVEMDADGSHPPETLPAMLSALTAGVGLAIGSRWVSGGRVVDWPRSRELLSRAANTYVHLALGIRVKDSTAGFRAYRAETLRAVDLSGIASEGYCFQIDLTLRTLGAGYSVVEVPIIFRERIHGVSKMSGGIVIEAMSKVTAWGIGRRSSQLRRLFRRAVV